MDNNTSNLCTKGYVETMMPLFKTNTHQQKILPPFHKKARYSPLGNLCNLHGSIAVLYTEMFYLKCSY